MALSLGVKNLAAHSASKFHSVFAKRSCNLPRLSNPYALQRSESSRHTATLPRRGCRIRYMQSGPRFPRGADARRTASAAAPGSRSRRHCRHVTLRKCQGFRSPSRMAYRGQGFPRACQLPTTARCRNLCSYENLAINTYILWCAVPIFVPRACVAASDKRFPLCESGRAKAVPWDLGEPQGGYSVSSIASVSGSIRKSIHEKRSARSTETKG